MFVSKILPAGSARDDRSSSVSRGPLPRLHPWPLRLFYPRAQEKWVHRHPINPSSGPFPSRRIPRSEAPSQQPIPVQPTQNHSHGVWRTDDSDSRWCDLTAERTTIDSHGIAVHCIALHDELTDHFVDQKKKRKRPRATVPALPQLHPVA
jgi:hypothetical protein